MNKLMNWIQENSEIDMSENQVSLISDTLLASGYNIFTRDEKIFLQSIDQFGEENKEVSLEYIITLSSKLKYKEAEKIMDTLDDIKIISFDNIKPYCKNLNELKKKEKELNLIERALVQTEHYKQINDAAEKQAEYKSKKIAR